MAIEIGSPFKMQRKSLESVSCPIARSLERVGEWWSILILRDAFAGRSRFEEFRKSLDIAPNMLSRRLDSLVEAGLLERRPYSRRPPRDEYHLTARGRDFRTVLLALLAYGERHFPLTDDVGLRLVDARTGRRVDPMLADRRSGRPLVEPDFAIRRKAPSPSRSTATVDAGTGLLESVPTAPKRRSTSSTSSTRFAKGRDADG